MNFYFVETNSCWLGKYGDFIILFTSISKAPVPDIIDVRKCSKVDGKVLEIL